MFGFKRRRNAAPGAALQASTPGPRADQLLQRLEWTVVRRLDGLLQGDYRTLFRGAGLDVADLREYQPQDDVRHMDWNVTARLQIPHVREFQEDREVAVWFLVDLSGSVDFGSEKVRKRTVAAELVGVLARLFIRRGNRVGAVLYSGNATQVIPARSGRRHLLHVLDAILRPQLAVVTEETDLASLLGRAESAMSRRSAVFLVSDFISRPGWGRALESVARRHELIAVRLFDPLEMALPDLGMVTLQDAETGEQMFVDTHDPGFRKRFADAARAREAELRSTLAHAGVDCVELGTADRLDEVLLAFTRQRKQRSQRNAGVQHVGRRLR